MNEKKKKNHEYFTTRFQTHFQEWLKNQQSTIETAQRCHLFAISTPKIHTQTTQNDTFLQYQNQKSIPKFISVKEKKNLEIKKINKNKKRKRRGGKERVGTECILQRYNQMQFYSA